MTRQHVIQGVAVTLAFGFIAIWAAVIGHNAPIQIDLGLTQVYAAGRQ